jgi:hypothetical protein
VKYKWFWTLTLREDLPGFRMGPRQQNFAEWYKNCIDEKFTGDAVDEDIIMKLLKHFNKSDQGRYRHGIYTNDEPGNFAMEYEYQEKLFYDTD